MNDAAEAAEFSLEDATSGLLSGEFGKQFGGSAMANLATMGAVGFLIRLKKLCDRPSKCKSHLHCPCLDVQVLDRSQTSIRGAPKTTDGSGPGLV